MDFEKSRFWFNELHNGYGISICNIHTQLIITTLQSGLQFKVDSEGQIF